MRPLSWWERYWVFVGMLVATACGGFILIVVAAGVADAWARWM